MIVLDLCSGQLGSRKLELYASVPDRTCDTNTPQVIGRCHPLFYYVNTERLYLCYASVSDDSFRWIYSDVFMDGRQLSKKLSAWADNLPLPTRCLKQIKADSKRSKGDSAFSHYDLESERLRSD